MNMKKGFTLVELLVVIGILGILMGALFPAIQNAMLSANLTAAKNNGRNIVMGIVTASNTRMAKGQANVWPHLTEDDGLDKSDTDDIAGQTFGTSTEYFKKLFDMDNYGNDEWEPYVDKDSLSALSAQGVPTVSSSSMTKNNVAWIIIAGMPDSMDSSTPALFTRNMDVSALPTSGSTKTSDKKDKIQLGKKNPAPFGQKACVVVCKGGQAFDFTAKDAKVNKIYQNRTVTFPDNVTAKYLEP